MAARRVDLELDGRRALVSMAEGGSSPGSMVLWPLSPQFIRGGEQALGGFSDDRVALRVQRSELASCGVKLTSLKAEIEPRQLPKVFFLKRSFFFVQI